MASLGDDIVFFFAASRSPRQRMPHVVHQTKTEIALQILRGRIRTGELKPGKRLRVTTLRDELAMSPTPIREALRLLQADGLVTYQPHQGITVAGLSPETTSEIVLLRSTLEALATELAVPKLGDNGVGELTKIHEQLVDALASGHGSQINELNSAWHWHIYDAAHSSYLLEFIRRLWDRYPWRTMWVLPGRAQKSIDEHSSVMEAILAGDAAEAGARMRAHILSGEKSLLDSASEGDEEPADVTEGGKRAAR
jgi:DNA-binding GntR family transcriptional regulator